MSDSRSNVCKVSILISSICSIEIFTSSFAAALYFEKHPLNSDQKVYIIGQEGIGEELALLNIPFIGGVEDQEKKVDFSSKHHFEYDKSVGAVVVGLDFHINYYKIQYAQICINQIPGCRFIATNTDAVTHLTEADEWAGNGACVGAIIGCTGKQPIVVGKPGALIIDYIMDKHHISKDRICMVGDRLDTDILFGLNNGLKTLLTLSGVTSKESLFDSNNRTHPDYYCDSIADVVQILR